MLKRWHMLLKHAVPRMCDRGVAHLAADCGKGTKCGVTSVCCPSSRILSNPRLDPSARNVALVPLLP